MSKAIIYARVSTEEQAKEGKSIETQLDLCRKWSFENEHKVVNEYIDAGKSGTDFNRPALQEMLLRCAEKDIDFLVVHDIDRLARDTFDHLAIRKELKRCHVETISLNQPMINDTPEGRFLEEILAASNALMPRITGRKTKAIMDRKFELGWWPSYAPIGYLNVKNETPSATLDRNIVIPNPKTAPLIKRAFAEYSTGKYSILTLTEMLDSIGLTGLKGGKLNTSAVSIILNNPFYHGQMKWGGKVRIGNHEPLITKDLFDSCQYLLAKHRNFLIRERKYDFLLRSFIKCQKCGWRYVAEWHDAHSPTLDKIAYYHCSNPLCKPKKYTEANKLELAIENLFMDFQFTEDFIDIVTEKAKEHFNSTKRELNGKRQILVNQRTAIETQRNTLEQHLLDYTIDSVTFKRLHTKLESQIQAIDDNMAKLESTRSVDFSLIEEILSLTRNVYQTYKDAKPRIKKNYLKFFFEEILVNDGEIVAVKANPLFESLKGINSVILSNDWLLRVDSNH